MSFFDNICNGIDFVIESTPVRHVAVPLMDRAQTLLGGGNEPSWYSSTESKGMRAGRKLRPVIEPIVREVARRAK